MAQRFQVARAAFWAATWAVGVALGVALGGWLTVVGASAVPGDVAIDLAEDIVLLPLVAGGVVFVVHLTGQLVAHGVRARRSARDGHGYDENPQYPEHDRVDR